MSTSPGPGTNDGTRAKLGGALRLLSVFIALCAAVLIVSAATQSWRRRTILGEWLTASATIRSCSLHRDFPFRADGGGIVFWIRCDVEYAAAGGIHAARLESSMRHAGRSGKTYTVRGASLVTERPEQELTAWIRKHPRGSSLTIRYDPAHAESATLVGVDPIVDVDPVPGSMLGVAVFGVLALLAWLGSGRLLRTVNAPATTAG